MIRLIILALILSSIFACRERADDQYDITADIILIRSSSDYMEAIKNSSVSKSDPFDIKSIVIKGDSVNITVGYPGGCKRHTFEIIWEGTISQTDPPVTAMIILHDSNGDICEAYITETLKISLANLSDDISFDTINVKIQNGRDPLAFIISGG